jgi:hypothetical protein
VQYHVVHPLYDIIFTCLIIRLAIIRRFDHLIRREATLSILVSEVVDALYYQKKDRMLSSSLLI